MTSRQPTNDDLHVEAVALSRAAARLAALAAHGVITLGEWWRQDRLRASTAPVVVRMARRLRVLDARARVAGT